MPACCLTPTAQSQTVLVSNQPAAMVKTVMVVSRKLSMLNKPMVKDVTSYGWQMPQPGTFLPSNCSTDLLYSSVCPKQDVQALKLLQYLHCSAQRLSDSTVMFLQTACRIHNMESVTDYRRLAHHHRGLFFTDDCKEKELQARFKEVAQPHPTRPLRVDVIMGRTLDVAQAGKSCLHNLCMPAFFKLTAASRCKQSFSMGNKQQGCQKSRQKWIAASLLLVAH